jgi:putative ABC transport system permease protein
VVSVGGTSALPLSGTDETYSFERQDQPRREGRPSMGAHYRVVTPQYFSTLGIPLLRGRSFDDHDTAEAVRVVVINESLARQYFPNEDPLGKRIEIGNGRNGGASEIVGIVKDLKHSSLAEKPVAEMYETYLQAPPGALTLTVRAAGDPRGLLPAIRRHIALLDPDIPLSKVLTMSDLMDDSLAPSRFRSALMDGFAFFAMVLAALGVYGIMAFTLNRRIAEIGIRVALGARPAQVLSLVIGRAFGLSVCGVAIGLAASLWLTRFLKGLLFAIGTTDPLTFTGAGLILIGVGMAASYVPARRAMHVDPPGGSAARVINA